MTCAFHEHLGERVYPYRASKVYLEPFDGKSVTNLSEGFVLPGYVEFAKKIHLTKWDCQPQKYPMSCYIARVWTFVYYGIPPFLLVKLINVLWAVVVLLKNLECWDQSIGVNDSEKALKIEPFSIDGLGGLGSLAEAGMGYVYSIVGLSMLVVMSFVKEGTSPSWHNYLILLLFIPVMLWAMLYPSLCVRKSILTTKDKYLKVISRKSNEIFMAIVEDGKSQKDLTGSHQQLSSLRTLHREIDNMPEWPFGYSYIIKIIATIFVPISFLFAETYIGMIFEGFLGK